MSKLIKILNSTQPILLILLPVLVTALLGYWLGLRTYFKRKEHEQIIHRYLEQGVDLLSANLDHALSIFRENWAYSLRLLKEFRGTASTELLRKESYDERFLRYEQKSFSIIPFYKVRSLVGEDIFWLSGQDLFAFVGNTYDFFENDLKLALAAYVEGTLKGTSPDEIYNKYLNEVRRLDEESGRFYLILKELQNIALFLETKPMSFKDLEKLKYRHEIKEGVQLLKDKFKETIPKAERENTVKPSDLQT